MSKIILIILTISVVIGVSLAIIFGFNLNEAKEGKSQQNLPEEQNPPETPSPQLVIPQTPLGTIGVFSAIAIALGCYLMIKKRK